MNKNNHSKEFIERLLAKANITINGNRSQDISIYDERFYARVVAQWDLGFGESYMDGWWDSKKLDELIANIFRADLRNKFSINFYTVSNYLIALVSNKGLKNRAFEIGKRHYDIGNDLFSRMLDKRLVYTCGYWKNAKTLDEAQENKLDLVCRKLQLKPGQTILDIGCGWGSFAKFAAEKYKVKVVGVTVSEEQVKLANELCKNLPVEIRLQDYRNITGQFDHIVSLGMFEHVCAPNYRVYMEVVHRCLKDDGLFLLHTIGGNYSDSNIAPWINKYIFPNSMLPSIGQIGTSIEHLFIMEDWHNFGADYDKTLLAWFENFDKGWPSLKEKYGDRFYRMWKFFLLSCAGAFRAREFNLWQVILSKRGVYGGYKSLRD